MGGYTGRIIEIDLTRGTARMERPEDIVYKQFLGGRGIAGHYLQSCISMAIEDPGMVIAGFAGPLTGTGAPSSDGFLMMSRSPLTGGIGDAVLSGPVGPALKRAGFDGIIVVGKSRRLSGIEIEDNRVSIVDATPLSDLTTDDLDARFGTRSTLIAVGPAGERMVPIADLWVSRGNTTGHSGLGALFGAKNLKYISIIGNGAVEVVHRKEMARYSADVTRLSTASPVLRGAFGFGSLGTPALFDLLHTRRMMPTDNFRSTFFEPAASLNASALRDRYGARQEGCSSCSVGCRRLGRDGGNLPELEALVHFTAALGNDRLDSAVTASRLCSAVGLDPVGASSSLACYQEITGTSLSWSEIFRLLKEMAFDKGLGAELNRGSAIFAERQGRKESAMTIKGAPISVFDPRGGLGIALSMAVATTGGGHRRADLFSAEVLRKPVAVDRFSFSGKARMVKLAEDRNAAADALVACRNLFFAASLEEYSALLSAVIGTETTSSDLMHIGERIIYQERIMNALNGLTSRDDDLPSRFFDEPGTSGPGFKTAPIHREQFLAARGRYYRIRGLGPLGEPTTETARRLGLTWKI
jgi:aldehyde:ferredoxin oxidoreductase